MSIDPFRGQLQAAAGTRKRVAEALPGASAAGLMSSSKMVQFFSGARAVVSSPSSNLPMPADAGVAIPGLQRQFQYAQGDAFGMDAPSRLTPKIGPAEELSNTKVVSHRVLYIPRKTRGGSSPIDLPSHDELAIIKIQAPRNPNYYVYSPHVGAPNEAEQTNFMRHFSNLPPDSWAAQSRPQLVQGRPAIGVNVAAWNYMIAEEQLRMYRSNDPDVRAQYDRLSPHRIWWGDDLSGGARDGYDMAEPLLPWSGWSLDGAPVIEETGDGRSARDEDGFSRTSTFGPDRPVRGSADDSKVMTMVMSGEQKLVDLVQGRGLVEGAKVHLILKRVPLSEDGHRRQTYVLSHKATPLQFARHDAVRRIEVTEKREATGAFEADVHFFRPFQLCAYASPDGSALDPLEFQHYEDERGRAHYDGLVLRIGTVVFAPIQYKYLPPLPAAALQPVSNGYEDMVREKMSILLDPYKDGAFSVL